MSDWLARLLAGHRGTLSRAITAVENNAPDSEAILAAVRPHTGRALLVGITGPPGAGKSTLVSAYMTELRKRGLSVGVVAVDPSSVVTGGAILGDRIRMGEHAGDEAIFVRSIAARGHLGGLARMTAGLVDLMDAAGKDVVIIETVGAGQSEIDVASLAHTCVVVVPPGLGDDVQAIKAGILEIADVLVVSKCDLPDADSTARSLNDRARMNKYGHPPVLRVVAPRGEGISAMADAIAAHARRGGEDRGATRTARMVIELAVAELRARLESDAETTGRLTEDIQRGRMSLRDAAMAALEIASAPRTAFPS